MKQNLSEMVLGKRILRFVHEVDLLEEWLLEGPKERKSEQILYQVSDACSSEPLLLFTYTIYILRNVFRRKLLFIS